VIWQPVVELVWYAYSCKQTTKGHSVKHKANPYIVPRMTDEQVRQVQELRRSGAAGKHADKRSKRARTRGAAKARALREQA